MKKYLRFLKSMKFGLVLLFYLAILSFLGSFIPQGRDEIFYTRLYSERISNLIMTTKAYDIYHSFYFILGALALCLNLLLCSLLRIKSLVIDINTVPNYKSLSNIKASDRVIDDDNIDDFIKELGFKKFKLKEIPNENIVYGRKNKIGYLGSWIIHLGVFMIIAFYTYGQYTYFSTAVYGVAATSTVLEGTDIDVKIHDFEIKYREDGTVSQYISNIELMQDNESIIAKDIYVNGPLRYKGYTFYQTSTGWASDIGIYKDGELIKKDIFYEGTIIQEEKENIVIQFTKFYPDFDTTGSFTSLSNELRNPYVLYSIFYNGHRVGMNVIPMGETIELEPYAFVFSNPQRYTYLQVNKMKGKMGAMVGSLLILLGLIICFYFKPKELVIRREKNKLYIYGKNISIDN